MSTKEKEADPSSDGYHDGSFLRYYRAVNEAHADCIAYVLGNRGFFAEVTTVARAMIYAWAERRQLVLDSSGFAYGFRDGWADYFEPFCQGASEVDPERIRERFRFSLQGDRSHFQKLRAFDPGRIRFGTQEITGMQPLIRHFMRLIFRLGYDSRRQVDRLGESLHLPQDYVAFHIRRGDKVGDEDIHYAVELYVQQLGELGHNAIFVMSDDYATVGEVREYLESHKRTNRVATLCRREHTGFDIWKLRAAESFAGGDRAFDGKEAHRRYVRDETNRLLAETVIASRAKRFVSNVRFQCRQDGVLCARRAGRVSVDSAVEGDFVQYLFTPRRPPGRGQIHFSFRRRTSGTVQARDAGRCGESDPGHISARSRRSSA